MLEASSMVVMQLAESKVTHKSNRKADIGHNSSCNLGVMAAWSHLW